MSKRKKISYTTALCVGSLIIVLILGFVAWKVYVNTPPELTAGAHTSHTSLRQQQSNEGKDHAALPKNALSEYVVDTALPRAIYINKLGVAARILSMGVNPDNSMQAPVNIYDTGWYVDSAKPGQDGAMVIDGHGSQSGTTYGIFSKLDTLITGDRISIEKGDGTKFEYQVAHTENIPESEVNMRKVVSTYGNAKQSLTLITCAGEWTKDHKTLDHRMIVFATLLTSH